MRSSYENFTFKFTNHGKLNLADVDNWYSSHVTPTENFFNTFYAFNNGEGYRTLRWVSMNALDQKFYTMFFSTSTQQRVLSNWRQLKFSREAWRCKLLAARHQNTLYRRFLGEEGVVWSIDRNAKDLLPG